MLDHADSLVKNVTLTTNFKLHGRLLLTIDHYASTRKAACDHDICTHDHQNPQNAYLIIFSLAVT